MNNFGNINARQTGYSFPFSLPLEMREGRKNQNRFSTSFFIAQKL